MDPRISPYAPGAGTAPPALAGRERETEAFDITLERLGAGLPAEGLVLAGPQGCGKTVLMNHFAAQAEKRGWFVQSEQLTGEDDFSDVIAVLTHQLLLQMSASRRFGDRLKRALGVLKAFTAVSALGVKLSIDVEAVMGAADSGMLRRDIAGLFRELGELAKSADSGVLFVFDELHTERETGALDLLDLALHRTAQDALPVTMVGAGIFPSWWASNPSTDESRVSTFASRMYETIRLGSISDDEARRSLAFPAENLDVEFQQDALREAVEYCRGHAWFLQLLGEAAWEAGSDGRITLNDVRAGIEVIDRRLNGDFFPRLLRRADPLHLRVLCALGACQEHPARIEDVARRAECSADDAWQALQLFLQTDVVTVSLEYGMTAGALVPEDRFAFSIPRTREYLAARYPELP